MARGFAFRGTELEEVQAVTDLQADIEADPDDLPFGDDGPFEPECWGEDSYEHYMGQCRHQLADALRKGD